MSTEKIAQLLEVPRARFEAWQAERRDVEALRRAGRALAGDPAAAADQRLQWHFTALRPLLDREARLTAALAHSLESDRAQFHAVTPWLRPMIVIRGLCDRAVLHHQLRQCRYGLGLRYEAMGRSVRASSGPVVVTTPASAPTPYRQSQWLGVVAQEGKALGTAVWQQLLGKLAPRVSALAGLAAGWWVASTYTDSHLRSVMNTVGLSRGGTHVVSGTTYKAMSFWLPILAAAVCAYLGDRLARAVRDRYDAGQGSPG